MVWRRLEKMAHLRMNKEGWKLSNRKKWAYDRKWCLVQQYIFNVFSIYFQIIFSDRVILLLCFPQQTIPLYLVQDPFRTRVAHWYTALTSFVCSHCSSYNIIIWTHPRSWKRSISKQIWVFGSQGGGWRGGRGDFKGNLRAKTILPLTHHPAVPTPFI